MKLCFSAILVFITAGMHSVCCLMLLCMLMTVNCYQASAKWRW